MPTVLWVLGEPCIGKTTLIRAFLPPPVALIDTDGWPRFSASGDNVAVGTYRGAEADGPRVNKCQAIAALSWWKAHLFGYRLLLLEGDAFMTEDILAKTYGCDRRLLLLEGLHLARSRRYLRGLTRGGSEVVESRRNSERFAINFPGPVAKLHPDLPVEVLVKSVRSFLDAPWSNG